MKKLILIPLLLFGFCSERADNLVTSTEETSMVEIYTEDNDLKGINIDLYCGDYWISSGTLPHYGTITLGKRVQAKFTVTYANFRAEYPECNCVSGGYYAHICYPETVFAVKNYPLKWRLGK